MKLTAYFTLVNTNATEFAKKIGVNQSSVSRFCNGTRRPDLTTLEKIHNATEGKVTAQDFFETPVTDTPNETLQTQSKQDLPASNVSQNGLKPRSKGSRTSIGAAE